MGAPRRSHLRHGIPRRGQPAAPDQPCHGPVFLRLRHLPVADDGADRAALGLARRGRAGAWRLLRPVLGACAADRGVQRLGLSGDERAALLDRRRPAGRRAVRCRLWPRRAALFPRRPARGGAALGDSPCARCPGRPPSCTLSSPSARRISSALIPGPPASRRRGRPQPRPASRTRLRRPGHSGSRRPHGAEPAVRGPAGNFGRRRARPGASRWDWRR